MMLQISPKDMRKVYAHRFVEMKRKPVTVPGLDGLYLLSQDKGIS